MADTTSSVPSSMSIWSSSIVCDTQGAPPSDNWVPDEPVHKGLISQMASGHADFVSRMYGWLCCSISLFHRTETEPLWIKKQRTPCTLRWALILSRLVFWDGLHNRDSECHKKWFLLTNVAVAGSFLHVLTSLESWLGNQLQAWFVSCWVGLKYNRSWWLPMACEDHL